MSETTVRAATSSTTQKRQIERCGARRELPSRTPGDLIVLLAMVATFAAAAGPARAARLDSVQSGTAVIVNGSSSTTANIAAVVPAQSILVFSVRQDTASPAGGQITGQLTGPTTLTFRRVGTSTNVTVEWSVAEFQSGVSVQRGNEPMTATTRNVSLAGVDLTKSFPIISLRIGGTVTSNDDFVRAVLTSSTNLRLTANDARADGVVEWQVVEYDGAVVRSGNVSFLASDSFKDVTVGAGDASLAWLIYSLQSDIGTQANIGQKMVRGLITGPTALRFDRDQTGQTLDLTWYLVEFQDATMVQHANASFLSGELQKDVPIASVDTARSFAVGGYYQRGGKSPYSSDDNPGVGWFSTVLTSSTNLRIRRDLTGSATADLGWFVLDFSGSTISGTVFEDVNYGGGPGRDRATAATDAPTFSIGRPGVTVELYDASGNHVSAVSPQITDAAGAYVFTGLVPGTYTVRVVNSTVTSSRPGSDGTELGVQTHRVDGMSEAPGTGAKKVGGERPSHEDAAANSGAQTLASLQGTDLDADGITEWTQSILALDASAGDVTGADFGFNFDVIVNTNDRHQGSVRQFILNSNLLN